MSYNTLHYLQLLPFDFIEPEMGELNKIVVPKIKVYWKDVAYALYYKINTVEAIEELHRGNPKKCCQELLKDWLTTDHGKRAGRKTWSTLLSAIESVEELVSYKESILKELANLY